MLGGMDKHRLSTEFYEHLTEKIMPFWTGLRDDEHGGYFGYVDYDLGVDKKAVKGCILNSRIMWFFANAYMLFGGEEVKALGSAQKNGELAELCLDNAKHAYEFMTKYCLDEQYGGMLWSVNYDGSVYDDIKHTYNQAFGIYALASYFDATGDRTAYDHALELMDIIETRCTDDIGYLEAFNRDFTPAGNDKLSENGVMADKTMNTLLHVFEAYTELLRVSKKYSAQCGPDAEDDDIFDKTAKRVADRLYFIVGILCNKIYNPLLRRQEVFFDSNYKSILDLHSYGHDIETSWLADRGLDVLDDLGCRLDLAPVTEALAERIYERAYVNHSLLNECEKGVDNTHRIWWVQAETVLGFMNAGQKCEEKGEYDIAQQYYDAVCDVWSFIQEKLTDSRTGSEWFWELDENLEPIPGRPIVEPWKCPYHNGRMCIEMIRRLG